MVHVILFSSVLIALLGREKSKLFTGVSFFVLFMFAALRYRFGNDYMGYYYQYLTIRRGMHTTFDEPLFVMLNKISPSFYILIAITSFFFVFTVYQLVRKNVSVENQWISVLIFVISPYLFLMNLSAIRQCIAMTLFVVSIRFVREKRLLLYVLCIIVATMFHKSTWILLPIYFIANEKNVREKHIIWIIIGMICLLFTTNFSRITNWFATVMDDANYLHYASNGMTNSARATLLTSIFFVYVLGNLPKLQGTDLVYAKLYLIGLAFGICAIRMSMLTRAQMYFDIFGIIAIPAILMNNRGKAVIEHKRIWLSVWDCINHYALPILIFLVYALRYYSFFTNPMWASFTTYQTIFSAF